MHDLAKMFLHCLNHWKLETPTQKKLHSQGEDLAAYKQNYTRSVDITSLHRIQKWPQLSRLLTVTVIPRALFLWRLSSTNLGLRFCCTFCIYLPMHCLEEHFVLSLLYMCLRVKTQQCNFWKHDLHVLRQENCKGYLENWITICSFKICLL